MNENPIPSWLQAIRYRRYRFYFKARAATTFDGFIGPHIRGALGCLLKMSKGCSENDNTDCAHCAPGQRMFCAYDRLCAHDSNHIRGVVLLTDPVLDKRRIEFKTGDLLRFDLVTVGRDISVFDDIAITLKRSPMRIGDHSAAFELVEFGLVGHDGHFNPSSRFSAQNDEQEETMGIPFKASGNPSKQVELILKTPAEITLTHKKYLKNPDDFSFKVFVMRMVERTLTMALQLCEFQDFKGTIIQEKSELISLSEQNVRLVEHRAKWRPVSLRTHPGRAKGGMVGSLVYEGNLAAFFPLLDAATVLGIGKSTSLGFGQVWYHLTA